MSGHSGRLEGKRPLARLEAHHAVTTALQVLEGNRFTRNDRGYVHLRDRAAMEQFAGDFYGAPETNIGG